jgi:hypothetical protein
VSLKPITVLRRARKLIESPKSWIQGSFVGKRKGVQCYCGLGALATAAGITAQPQHLPDGKFPREYYTAHSLLNTAAGPAYFPSFNDDEDTTHADVLAAFDRAIALAKTSKGLEAAEKESLVYTVK